MSLNTYQEQNVVLSMPTLLIEETNHLAANLGISYNDFYIQAIFAYLYRDVEDPIAIKLDQLYARSPELRDAIIQNITNILPSLHSTHRIVDTHNQLEQDKFEFPVVDCGPWPENLSLRREDLYDDWGR